MPVRRPSASAGQVSSSSTTVASSSRVHKSNDSYHYGGTPAGLYSSAGAGIQGPPQHRVVQSVINRLKNKLPCNSGVSLDNIEAEPAIQQTVECLVDLSRDSVDLIALNLSEVLERLAKQAEMHGHATLEVLQSQLFMLKVLAVCMASRWNSGDAPRPSSRASKPVGRAASASNVPVSPNPPGTSRQGRNMSTDQFSTQIPYSEPPPLDDNCARYILSVVILFLRQTAPPEFRLMSSANLQYDSSSSFYDLESIDMATTPDNWFEPTREAGTEPNPKSVIRNQASLSSMGSGGSSTLKNPTAIPLPAGSLTFERTLPTLCQSSMQLNTLIEKFAGRVVYLLSASNWPVVFTRIQAKIRYLSGHNTEENPDIIDLHLMSHSALDRARLVQIMQELSSLLLNMKREAQSAIAVPLRAAVWKWIDTFPEEFNDAARSSRRLEGAPERVFDALFQSGDSDNRKVLWPALTALLCISSDRLKSDYQMSFSTYPVIKPKATHRKENHFIEMLMRSISTWNKTAEIALVCALDMCRAAVRIRPDETEVPLLSIATDVVHEIKSVVLQFSNQRPFWESSDEIDVGLFRDAMAILYRFLPEDEAVELFSVCMEPERSDAVKTVAVKAALVLTLESPSLPWHRSLEKMERVMAPRMRAIISAAATRQNEVDPNGFVKRAAARPKSRRYTSETLSDRELLVLAICSLWRANYRYYFIALQTIRTADWLPVAIKVWESPMDSSVKQSTAWSIRYLCELIFQMQPEDDYCQEAVTWMKMACPATLTSMSMCLLNARIDLKAQRMWMDLAYDLLVVYTRTTDREQLRELQVDSNRVAAFAMAEIAFLVSLTSVDMKVSSLAAQCLRLIAQAERQPDAPLNAGLSEEDWAKRHRTYDQLGDPKTIILGRVGHQKRIRKLVRSMARPIPSHIAVWEECYLRWTTMTELAARGEDVYGASPIPDMTMSIEERRFQWQNLTLFLAAFGAACTGAEHDPSGLTGIIPSKYLPDNMRMLRDPSELMANFIIQLIDMLLSSSVEIRDAARDALGAELSSRLHSRLIKHLDEVIRDITQSSNVEWDETFATFLDQFLAVLKLLIENVEAPGEELVGFDINGTLLALAGFIGRFHDPASYKIRVKFCSLCDSIYGRNETLVIRRDTSASHDLLDIVIDWVQDPAQMHDIEALRIQYELNIASLRTTVRLMDRLKLNVSDGENPGHAASRLFKNYYDFLLKALEYTRHDGPKLDDGVSERSSTSQRSRAHQRDVEFRELVVQGLANLISSNTESSLRHCIPLAYHKDFRKRAIFAQVFARVLGQGTKLEFESSVAAAVPKKSRLCELVKGSEVLAVAMCETCPASDTDVLIPVLFNLFDTRASLMSLLKTLIDREIAQTENESSLFRSNNTTARVLSHFAKTHGYNYLRSLIIPLIKSMATMPPGCSYELDPTKPGVQDVKQNQKNVEFVASSFLNIITASVPTFPSMFREICAHLAQSVQDVWPEAKFKALGSFIFLRFLSPAVVAPETVDVEVPKESEPVIRRGLLVIAKIIQNLANNIFFGKEAHMEVLNDFLRANIVNVTRFLSEVNKFSTSGTDDDPDEWLGESYDDSDTIVLHRFFEKHGDKVGKDLLSLQKPQAEADASAINGKRAWNTLCSALVDLGGPFEAPRLSPWTTTEHREYLDLMSRYSTRSTEPVRDLFVDVPMPKNRPAVFVFCLSKIDVEALDVDLFMYHVLKTVSLPDYQNQPFEVIIDCTSFAASTEVPIQWVKYCVELLPSDVRQRMVTVHLLNPSQQAQKYFRRLSNIAEGMPSICEVKVHSWVADLLQHVPEQVLDALSYPASLEQEEYEEYREVTMHHCQQHMPIPVIVHVGTTHLRITSLKSLPLSPTKSCKITEIVSLAEISDVYNISTGQDPNEFIIRRCRHGLILYFASPARDVMVKSIRNAKGQMRNVPLPGSERFSRLSNVSATLLHMGFFLVGYEDEELRYAACELLAALCSYLDYEGSPVVPSKAGFLPAHPPTFVAQLSERLAGHAPQLTLDFFTEVANGMEKLRDHKKTSEDPHISQRVYCLKYLSPWIKNLAHLCNPTSPYHEPSSTRLRDSIVLLVDMTIADQELDIDFQQYIWAEIGKLDITVINPVLEELMRAAIDGGIGSPRCEIVANILSVLSSLPVRGKILSRLRKVITKTSSKAVHTLEENTFWNEAACLTRLALVVGAPAKQAVHNQFYVPEIVHLVSLMAAGGQTLVRTSVYGIVVNLLQALYMACGEDAAACSQIRLLLDECTQTESLELFGLTRANPSSEYSVSDPNSDKAFLERYERLAQLLVRVVEAGATSKGLLNVWRARWMSLVVSTAFQYFPPIQSRSFVILGELATSDVDDDLLYQMLVAFKTAMAKPEAETTSIISMLRCISKVTPGLMDHSRYLPQVLWLAVSLLQSGHMALYADAADLLRRSIEKLHSQGTFKEKLVSDTLLEARAPLIEVVSQLDQMLQLSFESNFSFSMAATIFKGVRVSGLRQSAEAVLRSLLHVTVRVSEELSGESPNAGHPLPFEALGYFLALIPFSTTPESYRKLLTDCDADSYWPPDEEGAAGTDADVPHIPFDFLGVTESNTALLVTSFVSAMLSTAQGDDAETEIFYTLLSDIADAFPEIIQLTFESMMERIKDTFSHSTNPAILIAVSNILKVAMQDSSRSGTLRGSASSLTTVDEGSRGPGPKHLDALEEMGMRGLPNTFQFLPGRNHGGKMLTWIPEIVSRVIEFGDP